MYQNLPPCLFLHFLRHSSYTYTATNRLFLFSNPSLAYDSKSDVENTIE